MKKCIYLTKGECEEKLVKALKEKPSMIAPGKVWKFNVIQISRKAHLMLVGFLRWLRQVSFSTDFQPDF